MEGRAKGPSAPPEKVARVGGPEAQGVGEERQERPGDTRVERDRQVARLGLLQAIPVRAHSDVPRQDRKSTRLNSSHGYISYAVFCLKKKKKQTAYGGKQD